MELQGTTFADEFSKEIYEQTYKYGSEDINGTQQRVAKFLSSKEKEQEKREKEFQWALENFKFVPGGRITSNAGTGLTGTSLVNCFVSGFQGRDQDSIESILDELNRQTLILKSEGGYGFCVNTLRPRTGFIHGIGNSSPGAVKMLEMWDTHSSVITAGSGKKSKNPKAKKKIRKGAQMVTMSCWHPDILEFITAKQTPGRLTKFNMSVLITDDFMKAVENGDSWNLEFPDYAKAKDHYTKICFDCQSKLKEAEKVSKKQVKSVLQEIENCKECDKLVGWDGNLKKWKEAGLPIRIYNSFENANELWDIIMKSTYNRNEPGVLFVDTMNKMNNLYYNEHINATNPCVTGDTEIYTSPHDITRVKDLVGKQFQTYVNGKTYSSTEQGFWSTGVKEVFKITFEGTGTIIISDNDHIGNKCSIKATGNHRFQLIDNTWITVDQILKKMAWSSLTDSWMSFNSDIKLKKANPPKEFNDGKMKKVVQENELYYKIIKIERAGNQEVFDCTIPEAHCYNSNGLISHNCGEQILPIGGVCLLGSINLTQFFNEACLTDSKQPIWDYSLLDKLIPVAVRMMDNVNDLTYVPLEEQEYNLKNKRRIGLGILGYASSLMMAKTRYGSDKALEETNRLMEFISNKAYQSSAYLAKEKGAFPLFDKEKYLAGEFVKVLSEETRGLIKKHGVRNSHLLSIQPTGNSSVYANNVSGGLEPIFMAEYTRTTIMPYPPEGLHLPENIDFKDNTADMPQAQNWHWVYEGDESLLRTEFNGYIWKIDRSRGLLRETVVQDYAVRYLVHRGEWDPKADYASTTLSLGVDDHVKTMKIFAKYVCSAISKTQNIPQDYPYSDFKRVYQDAYNAGIKGITTYRAGTMTAVLSGTSKPNKIQKAKAPPRPEYLDCDINTIVAGGIKYVVMVGLLDERPFEIFAFKEKDIKFSKSLKKGKLRKMKRESDSENIYSLETEFFHIYDLGRYFDQPVEESMTRMMSMSLKHGVDISEIYRQLQKANGSITSFSKAIARTLSKYVKDWTDTKCQECKDPNGIIFQEGCLKCKNCGYSKCL